MRSSVECSELQAMLLLYTVEVDILPKVLALHLLHILPNTLLEVLLLEIQCSLLLHQVLLTQ